MLNDLQNGGLRELDAIDAERVSGGGSLGAAWKVGDMIGSIIYDNLSPETATRLAARSRRRLTI